MAKCVGTTSNRFQRRWDKKQNRKRLADRANQFTFEDPFDLTQEHYSVDPICGDIYVLVTSREIPPNWSDNNLECLYKCVVGTRVGHLTTVSTNDERKKVQKFIYITTYDDFINSLSPYYTWVADRGPAFRPLTGSEVLRVRRELNE